jgi:hypothetical protein
MNTFIDDKFRETVWNSKIPVKIDMALEDINDVEKPPSLYVIKNNIFKETFKNNNF